MISAVRESVAGGSSSVGGCSGSTSLNKSSIDNPTNSASSLKFDAPAIASIASGLVMPGVSANASESDAPANCATSSESDAPAISDNPAGSVTPANSTTRCKFVNTTVSSSCSSSVPVSVVPSSSVPVSVVPSSSVPVSVVPSSPSSSSTCCAYAGCNRELCRFCGDTTTVVASNTKHSAITPAQLDIEARREIFSLVPRNICSALDA